MPRVVFKFSRPAGAPKKPPSAAMTETLQRLSEAEEMRDFTAKARALNRTVVFEVFHSSDGHPLLIHVAAVRQQRNSVDLTSRSRRDCRGVTSLSPNAETA
jgi:hypothetical protein